MSSITNGNAPATSNGCSAQQWITSKTSQGLFWILTLGHCSVYMLGPSRFEGFTSFVLFVWFTGAPLAVMTILEVCIRVSVQAGPIWRFKSWRRMMIPLFHQLEAFVMAVMAFRGGMSIYLLLVAFLGDQFPTSVSDQDKATVLVLCGYRALRTWGDFHGVSVQSTLRWRRRQARRQKFWMNEYKRQLEEHRQLFFVRMQRCVDNRISQLALFFATVFYCFVEFQDAFPLTSLFWGYMLIGAFFCEFLARAKAQGGEYFFRPMYNKLEILVLAAGTWCLFYASWYTSYLAESKQERTTIAYATAFLLLLHRCIRLLAIRFQVSGSYLHANTLMSAKAMEIFMAKYGSLVEVAPTNIHVDVPGSMVHIKKATLKPEAFEDLHLPLTLSGGLIEDFFVDFFTPDNEGGGFARVRTNGKTRVRIKNLLLVMGPGRGLAEAGGSRGSYWNAENIEDAKSRVVDFIYTRLSAPFPDVVARANLPSRSQDSLGSKSSKKTRSWSGPRGFGHFAQKMHWKLRVVLNSGVRRFKNLLQDSALRNLDLDIRNASVQFQDSSGALGYGCLSMGLKMDSLKLMRHAGKHMNLHLARLSFYVEPFGGQESWQKKSLTAEKPQRVVRKMVQLNTADRLRSWAFSELRQRLDATERLHQMERWPERHNILMIPWVSLNAGPEAVGEVPPERVASGNLRVSHGLSNAIRKQVQRVTRVTRSRISSDIEDQQSSHLHKEIEEHWHWKLQVRPVIIMVDDVQLGCVRHLHHCVRSWWAWDAAFRWRPKVTPLDPTVTPKERPAVVRFWWYYTLHRVLAKRSGQRRMPLKFLDLVLKAGYRFKYRSMLTAVVGRSGPLIPGSRVFLKPSPQQQKQLQELQMHLAYPDIVSCYRAVLAKAVGQGSHASYAIRAAQQAEAEVVAAVEVEQLEALTEEEEEEEEMVEINSADSADSSDEEDPSGSGTWELRWSGLEVWIPFWRPGQRYRPVFLHVNFQDLAIDAEVLEKDGSEGKLAPFSMLCALKSFSFSSPECGKIQAAAKDVVKINQLVSMAPTMFNSVFHLGPKDWACIGEQFALIVQARAISGKEVHAVVHCPECKVMLWEPLILTLRAFLNEHSKEDAKTLSVVRGGRITKKDGKVSAKNGRIGPTSVSATFESFLEVSGSMQSQAPAASEQTKLTKRLQNAQRLFERVVLIQEDIGVNITLNLRAIQIFQIGKFSRDQLGIEEARVFPQDVSAKVLRSDDPVAFTSGRSRTGTMWAESGSKMCSIAGALDAYANRSRQARSSSFPSQPWVAGSPLVPAFRQEDAVDAPELPDASILGLSWHPFWIPYCCSSNAGEVKSTAPRVAGPPIERVPRDALGKALVHLAFWKLRPHEFSIEWMQKQEADWRHKVTLSRGQLSL